MNTYFQRQDPETGMSGCGPHSVTTAALTRTMSSSNMQEVEVARRNVLVTLT